MIRYITEQTQTPNFMMLCDHSGCGAAVIAVPQNSISYAVAEEAFVKEAVNKGWVVRRAKQLCPHHASGIIDNSNLQGANRIVVPTIR